MITKSIFKEQLRKYPWLFYLIISEWIAIGLIASITFLFFI